MDHTRTDQHGLCRCGHSAEAHEHYRRGTDCSLCDCPRLRPAGGADRWAALRSLLPKARPPR